MTYVELTLTTQGGDVYTITNKDIAQGGLSVNGYSCNGDFLEVGTAISKEMKLTLENIDGRWDDVEFIGDTCDLKQLEMSTWNSMAEGDYEEMVIGDGTVYVDYTKIVNDTSLDLGSRTFLMTDFTCIDSEDVLSSNLTPGATYTMLSNPSSVATFRMVEKNGSTTVGTHDINGTEYRFIATEGNTYQFYAVMLQTVPAWGKFDINFVLSETTTIPLGTYIIDDCTYSRGRVSLTALDFLYKLDVFPAILNDYNEAGFKVYSSGMNVRTRPIGTSTYIYGTTKVATVYTIKAVEDNEYGRWLQLTPTDKILDMSNNTIDAGDNAWISTSASTGRLYPYSHAGTYIDANIMSGYTTMDRIFTAELMVNNVEATNYNIMQLSSDVWTALAEIEVNIFQLGNQFTLRQLLAWSAGYLGECVYVNDDNEADFIWYDTTVADYNEGTAYSMELQKKPVSVTGLTAEIRGKKYEYGTSDYMISIGSNPVMDSLYNFDADAHLQSLFENFSKISYYPFTASVVETPQALVLNNITYTRKNLLPYPFHSSTYTSNGITFTDNGDGTVTANGTSSGTAIYQCIADQSLRLPNGTYVLSGTPSDILSSKIFMSIYGTVNGTASRLAIETEPQFTVTDNNSPIYQVRITITIGQTLDNVVFQPMIRSASITDDTYEPYFKAILPVTDWTWVLNGATSLRGRGNTNVNKQYSSTTGSTSGSSISYTALNSKPTINGVQLVAGLTGDDVGLLPTAGGTMTGNIQLGDGSVTPRIVQVQRDTSHWSPAVQWDTDTGYTESYKPSIGQHNTGEAITILPYATDTAPYGGNVGLYLKHASTSYMKYEGKYVGRFTATPTGGQVVVTDGTVGGMQSSGYTIAASVPSGAKFTDTTYTGTGLVSVNSSTHVISTTATKNTMGGTYRTSVWAASASVANNTWTRKGTITLAAGYYVLTFTVNWASATAGKLYRSSLSTTSADEEPARSMAMATTGQICRYEHTVVLHPTASTTYYYNVFQNSGAAINCSVYLEYLSIT